jgi:hypothetical protein
MTEQRSPKGISERLLSFGQQPPRGYLRYVVASGLLGVLAAGSMALDLRFGAAANVLLGAMFGGLVAVAGRRAEVSTWQRAAGVVVNISAEGLMLAAAAVWARSHEDWSAPLAVGFLAFGGAILLSYARTRIRASAGMDLADGPWGIASREVRLVVLAIGVLSGQVYWALVIIAALANGAVLGHLGRLRLTLRG